MQLNVDCRMCDLCDSLGPPLSITVLVHGMNCLTRRSLEVKSIQEIGFASDFNLKKNCKKKLMIELGKK